MHTQVLGFKDVDLSKVNILKDFKTMPGKIVVSWMVQPKSFFPDRIDRLNGYIVPALFLLCVTVLSTTVYGWIGGDAISCLPSSDIEKEEYEYAVDYCMSKNHYYVHPDEQIPWSDQQRYANQLGYYHWVVVFLLLQAFFFWLPSCLWSYASTAT
ncbi:INX-13 protein, partial [Aphelenchoides avenae]